MDTPSCRMWLIPCPIPPLVAYAFFLYRHLQILKDSLRVRYHYGKPGSSGVTPRFFSEGNGMIWKFRASSDEEAPELFFHLQSLLSTAPQPERNTLLKLLSFCAHGKRARVQLFEKWLAVKSLRYEPPIKILEDAAGFLEECLAQQVNLWQNPYAPKLPLLPDDTPTVFPYPSDKRFVTLPFFKEEGEGVGKREVVGFKTFGLSEGRVWDLQEHRICGVIGGPPGAGKTTLAVSLAAEMKNIVRGLQTRRGWGLFSLNVDSTSVDFATPTIEAVKEGRGKDRGHLDALKRPWTEALALEAFESLHQYSEGGVNILLADLPGLLTPITEIVAAPADFGILITDKWEKIPDWRKFMDRMGILVLAELKSKERSSIITKYKQFEYLAGRVELLDRVTRAWDLTIQWLAEFLLFEILPTLVRRRRERLEYFLNTVEE